MLLEGFHSSDIAIGVLAKEPMLDEAGDLAFQIDLIVQPGLHLHQLLLELAHLVDLLIHLGLLELLEPSILGDLGFWSSSFRRLLHEIRAVALDDYEEWKKRRLVDGQEKEQNATPNRSKQENKKRKRKELTANT